MKRSAACLACILAAGIASAGVQIGLDFDLGLNPVIRTSVPTAPGVSTDTRTNFSLGIQPYIGIRPGDLLEIRPSVNFQFISSSTDIEYDSSTSTAVKSSISQAGLGLGVAVLFHVIRKEFFELALGPQLSGFWWFEPSSSNNGTAAQSVYSKFYSSREEISLPIKFDFYFNRHFGARIGAEILGLTYVTHSYEFKSGSTPDVMHDIDFHILTSWVPNMGLFLRF
jgi:hypothetical protein